MRMIENIATQGHLVKQKVILTEEVCVALGTLTVLWPPFAIVFKTVPIT